MTNVASGFTLIELLVVVLIIGILASVALPQYQKAVEKSKAAQALTLLKTASQAVEVYQIENSGACPASFDELDFSIDWKGSDKWLNIGGVPTTVSNSDWSLQIFCGPDNQYISVGRISGPYAGAAFIFLNETQRSFLPLKTVMCVERKATGVTFEKERGAYCKKLFGGTFIPETEGLVLEYFTL